MPTYIDRHDVPGASAAQVADAHVQDLRWQDEHDVRFLTYWFDPDRGAAFCLAEGPDASAIERCHQEAHGLVPHTILEVDPRSVASFLGAIIDPEPGTPWAASAFRTLMITDIVDSTPLLHSVGDVAFKDLVLALDEQIEEHVTARNGRRVDHTGDGVLASFASAADGLACATSLQRAIAQRDDARPVRIRIGLAAGEPVQERDRLFGAAVNMAARICAIAEPSTVYIPGAVRELVLGKGGFTFRDRGHVELKGFTTPVQIFEVSAEQEG